MVVSELQATAAKVVRIRRSRSFMVVFRILHTGTHAAKLESMKWVLPLLLVLMLCLSCASTTAKPSTQIAAAVTNPMPKPDLQNRLTDLQVTAFAQLALAGIVREWPNKPGQVYSGPESALTPRAMHPVFYGSFDWHSAVHGHWLLVRLLKEYPNASSTTEIRRVLNQQLETQALLQEAAYFDAKQNSGFERMYGWAWLLRLATELHAWDDADGRRWAAALRPLEQRIVVGVSDYLPRLSFPIRTGTHPDTAFALAFELDYARAVGNTKLAALILQKARDFYLADRDYPSRYEPSGEDFFSSGLNEADLMRRVLPQAEFVAWLDGFLPDATHGDLSNLGVPVHVSDPTDGRLVHLAGLDLSRAWTLHGIANALPEEDLRRQLLTDAALAHTEVGLDYVFSGFYEGDHWLASFAVYLLTGCGL